MTLKRRLKLVPSLSEKHWMPRAVKVAFATGDMRHVDQHFGAARSFAIYAVDQDAARFVEVNEFSQFDMNGNEDKLAAKIAVLQGCIAVYVQAIGASAIGQLTARGIHPVKVSHGAEILDVIESLQRQLRDGPSQWLAKAIAGTLPVDLARFDRMEVEGWEE